MLRTGGCNHEKMAATEWVGGASHRKAPMGAGSNLKMLHIFHIPQMRKSEERGIRKSRMKVKLWNQAVIDCMLQVAGKG